MSCLRSAAYGIHLGVAAGRMSAFDGAVLVRAEASGGSCG